MRTFLKVDVIWPFHFNPILINLYLTYFFLSLSLEIKEYFGFESSSLVSLYNLVTGDMKVRLENPMCVFYISRLGNKYWCLSNIEN